MSRRAFSLAAAVVASLALSCGDRRPERAGSEAGIGSAAPAFQGKTLAGDYVALSDFQGKVVLLNVWATWCTPCRKELPELAALHGRYAADGFMVLGISADAPGAKGQIDRMVRQFQLPYPIVLDPHGSGLDAFAIRGYPTSFLIGRDGTVRWRRDGIIEPGEGELAAQIKAALAQ